jgi:hypothetical protein
LVDDDDDEGPFMVNMAQFYKFWYRGSEGEKRKKKAKRAEAKNGQEKPVIYEEDLVEKSPGGNNGKRAVAWDYFEEVASKQKLSKAGKPLFSAKGNKIMQLEMKCLLPKAGCLDGKPCGKVVKVTTGNGTTPMLLHLRTVSEKIWTRASSLSTRRRMGL